MIYVNPQLLTEIVLRVKLKLKFLSICCEYILGWLFLLIETRFSRNHRNSITRESSKFNFSKVEPSDSSYMPSLVEVKMGHTVGGLRELKKVSVPSSAREAVLLTGMTEVGPMFTLFTLYLLAHSHTHMHTDTCVHIITHSLTHACTH